MSHHMKCLPVNQANIYSVFLKGNSRCVTVTLRQKKEKPIVAGGQEHFKGQLQ